MKINLIDDSLIPEDNIQTYFVRQNYNKRDKKPTLEMFKKKTDDSFLQNGNAPRLDKWHNEYFKQERWTYTENDIIHEGCVNRKTVLKDKKKPSVGFILFFILIKNINCCFL